MEEWDRVIKHTSTVNSSVLSFWAVLTGCVYPAQVLKVQSENAKAFYRRGVARLRLGLLDGAEEDLMAANQMDPNGVLMVEPKQRQ